MHTNTCSKQLKMHVLPNDSHYCKAKEGTIGLHSWKKRDQQGKACLTGF